jgi:hypothetical protein
VFTYDGGSTSRNANAKQNLCVSSESRDRGHRQFKEKRKEKRKGKTAEETTREKIKF